MKNDYTIHVKSKSTKTENGTKLFNLATNNHDIIHVIKMLEDSESLISYSVKDKNGEDCSPYDFGEIFFNFPRWDNEFEIKGY